MHPSYTPILFELTALRLLSPYWPTGDHYCRMPVGTAPAIQVRSVSAEYLDLVAHHLEYQRVIGAVAAAWRVSFIPHLAGAAICTFAIEPARGDEPADAHAQDLVQLGASLGDKIRELAYRRVLAMGPLEDPRGASARLSAREREVLDLFVCGLGIATLSRRLFISEHTVRNHLKHICSKLGVGSQRELRELFALPGG